MAFGFTDDAEAEAAVGGSVELEAMPYALTPATMIFGAGVVLVVCVVSAVLSTLRVLQLELADVFKT